MPFLCSFIVRWFLHFHWSIKHLCCMRLQMKRNFFIWIYGVGEDGTISFWIWKWTNFKKFSCNREYIRSFKFAQIYKTFQESSRIFNKNPFQLLHLPSRTSHAFHNCYKTYTLILMICKVSKHSITVHYTFLARKKTKI